MLSFPLKEEWYNKIKAGEKTVEYREVKLYWTKRIQTYSYWYTQFLAPKDRHEWFNTFPRFFNKEKAICLFRLGYTNEYLYGVIKKIEIVDGKNTDLKINKPVYAIHFELCKEKKRCCMINENTD